MVELIWHEVLLVLLPCPFLLYSFPIFLQLFPGNFKDVPKACCYTVLLFRVCLIKCCKMSIVLSFFFLCPGIQISKLCLDDRDEDLGCCLLSCAVACPWQKRSLPALVCSAPRADSCFHPKGNPHYFIVHVQEV